MEEKWNRLLAQRLEAVRKELGLTKGKLAEAMNTTQKSMTSYLQGTTEPKPSYLAALCSNHNVSAQWLLTGDGPMFCRSEAGSNYHTLNRWADQIQETVEGYTQGLAPLSQILSALWHTVGDHIEGEDLRKLREKVQAKDKEPDAAEVHQQAAKELYELKAALEQTDMDPEDRKTLYRHVVQKYYGFGSGAIGGIPVEDPGS